VPSGPYSNPLKNTEEGRPHVDVVLMTNVLVTWALYALADEMIETECKDKLTFQNFSYPSGVLDSKIV